MLINHYCPNPECGLTFKADSDEEEVLCPECGEEVRWLDDYNPNEEYN